MFPTGTLLFQSSQPIQSGNNLLLSIDAMEWCLEKLGQKYSFKKKSDTQHENAILKQNHL